MNRRDLITAALASPMAMFAGIDKFHQGELPINRLMIDCENRSDGLWFRFLYRDGTDKWEQIIRMVTCDVVTGVYDTGDQITCTTEQSTSIIPPRQIGHQDC